MAVPVALMPPAPVNQTPISAPSSSSCSSSSSSSSSPAISSISASSAAGAAGSTGQSLFRADGSSSGGGGGGGGSSSNNNNNKPVYSTPSPVENTPQNNECKMVELRGAKVASFTVDGHELICLPQAFDLFLKHLVGGLHTVYTKLKRLDITPVVCNVEQVRILRGLGAIQPGVNRCKLISRKDFEILYNDCTNASSRPGRPPKRSQSVTSPENSHIVPHTVPGLMSPGMIPPTGLTAAAAAAAAAATNAAIAEAMKAKKIKLEAMNSFHGNSNQHGTESENGDMNSSIGSSDGSWDKEKLQSPTAPSTQGSVSLPPLSSQHNLAVNHSLNSLQQNHLIPNGLELPFMMMPHPLIPVSLPPASVTMAMSQMNHLTTIANMAAAAQVQSPPSRMETSVIKERVPDSPSPAPSLEDGRRPGSHPSSHRSSSVSSSPARTESSSDRIHEVLMSTPTTRECFEKLSLAGQHLPPGFPTPLLFPDGLSSIETLLTNIQGLLKVAIDNARAQEKQVQHEKTELKMELFREREMRESLEKQLAVEQKNRAIIQKRLKKEKKAKRKLQEALEFETKRREQAEQALKQAASADNLRVLNDSVTQEMEADRSTGRTDAERTIQDGRMYLKSSVMY
ncbi:dachshund homolog 1-like isoform X3 [Carcharodon carcharias]|uniref:dachshund homolog 1-like isoform X3 n=1 Tax=Carcharodon carcharias TaxID=13397 RepID=UPI001B7E496A|nr:dachshund homolog 1-like isoform X3 [Carcharodon carcharias]